jgi:uncharacterized protein YndB with AHSA1/START domain
VANLHPWPKRGNCLDFVQHVRATPDRIWRSLTCEEDLQRWLRVTTAEIPETPGAPFALNWETRGHAQSRVTRRKSGFVKAYVPGKLLALEWILPVSQVTTHLSIQIQRSFALFGESCDSECDVWLIHSGFPEEGVGLFEFDGHHRHWRQDIGTLAALLENRRGKPTPYSLAGISFVGGAPDVGLLVCDVFVGSPAHVAGIRTGDIIRAVDGQKLHSLDDFHDWIDDRRPGETGRFTLGDREVDVTVEGIEEARKRLVIRRGGAWVERFDLPARQAMGGDGAR